jgi:hypothetical protein
LCDGEETFGTTALLKRNGRGERSSERAGSQKSTMARTKQLIAEIGQKNWACYVEEGLGDHEIRKNSFFKEKLRRTNH